MHRVDVQLEDDLTGGPADETILFSLDGRSYEIDLNSRHAAEFRHRLVPFTEHARLVRPQRARVTVRSAASRERSKQIRMWAEESGFALSPHGRLPGNVIQQYELEHAADRAEAPSRRLAGQRGGPSRQARKTSGGARSVRRSAPRGALPQRRRKRASVPFRGDVSPLTSSPGAWRRYNAASATYGSGHGSACPSQYHPRPWVSS
jgi:hypothetical protein